jgi:hypothetical protein
MKNQEIIIKMFNEGASNVEIGQAINYDNSEISKAIKALGLVRTEAQKSAIKSRAQLGSTYKKGLKSKFKKEQRVSTYESKNYVLDDIRKGLINTGNLENDIELSVVSIQKLRENFAKIPKFTKQNK